VGFAGVPTAGIPEVEVAAFVDKATSSDEGRAALTALLPEESPLYAGLGTNQTKRLRGYVLAAFERVGLPDEVLPYVLEELESGHEAYLVAAAARALRGFAGDASMAAPYLARAVENVRYADEVLSFEQYVPARPFSQPTTAVAEALESLAWLGHDAAGVRAAVERWAGPGEGRLPNSQQSRVAAVLRAVGPRQDEAVPANCCWTPPRPKVPRHAASLARTRLEDQDGASVRWGDYFAGKPSVVAFFYTRCSNPNKCSLTVTRLNALASELARRGLQGRVRVGAITYDPAYDLPPRLRAFGMNRGIVFGDDLRLFRAPEDQSLLRQRLGLGVNYAGPVVNRHRIELFVIDGRGEVVAAHTRMQWDAATVASDLEALLAPARSWFRRPLAATGRAAGVPAALALALLPKCPMCWAAYMAAAGVGGLQGVLSRGTVVPLLLILLAVHVALAVRNSRMTGRHMGVLLSGAGAMTVLAGSVFGEAPAASYFGATLLVLGALIGSRAGYGSRHGPT
jgi:protein SCO1/2